MKCPNCGADNISSARFCRHCGSILGNQHLERKNSQYQPNPGFFARNKKLLIVIFLAVVIIGILILILVVSLKSAGNKMRDAVIETQKQQAHSGNGTGGKSSSSPDERVADRLASSKARSAKALASLSSAIPSMISCGGNAGSVRPPASGSDICSLASSYGTWPLKVGDLSSYNFDSSTSDNANCPSGVSGNCLNKSSWFVSLTSGSSDDNKRICCNSTINSCEILDTAATACDASAPSY